LLVFDGVPPFVPVQSIHPSSRNSANAAITGRRVRPINFASSPKLGLHCPVLWFRYLKSWPRKFEQADKWSFCLKAAMIAANRREHEQTTAPEP
jgi:hypothetical protein